MPKSEIARACASIIELSTAHGIEVQAAVGLMSLHALAVSDLTMLRLWRSVADELRDTAPLPA